MTNHGADQSNRQVMPATNSQQGVAAVACGAGRHTGQGATQRGAGVQPAAAGTEAGPGIEMYLVRKYLERDMEHEILNIDEFHGNIGLSVKLIQQELRKLKIFDI